MIAEQSGRIGDALDSVVVQLETADLVGCAEAVLDTAHHAQRGRPVTLEVQHDVDEVLERARPRDGAVLGDVADQDHRDASGLGRHGERRGDRTDLGDAAGDAVGFGGGHGLHRVDHDQRGLHRLDVAQRGLQVGFGGQVYLVVGAPGAFGTQSDLSGRLLTRQVERAAARLRPAVRDLEQQRRLADPRIARQQGHRSGDEAAAEHAVQFAYPRAEVARRAWIDGADRDGRGGGGERTPWCGAQ